MTSATLTVLIYASIEAVRRILMAPTRLPDWNPAFIRLEGAPVAVLDQPYRLTVIRGLRGTFTYTRIDPDVITMSWHTSGLSEECSWHLVGTPHGNSTTVTHTVERHGVLSALAGGAVAELPALRLERLAEQLDGRGIPASHEADS